MDEAAINTPRIGLALGSGGSRGLAHVGVIKVLTDAGFCIHTISGSSAGALVGALYARDRDIERVEERVTSPSWVDLAKLLFDVSLSGGVIKGRRLAEFIRDEFKNKKFSDLVMPFAAVSTDLKTGQSVALTTGPLRQAILASMAVPFVFSPVRIEGKTLVDGGLVEPVPVARARALGADIVIAVNLDGKQTLRFTSGNTKPLDVMQQSISIYRYNLAQSNAATAELSIEPSTGVSGIVGWGGLLRPHQIIKTGERAMRKALPDLKRLIASRS